MPETTVPHRQIPQTQRCRVLLRNGARGGSGTSTATTLAAEMVSSQGLEIPGSRRLARTQDQKYIGGFCAFRFSAAFCEMLPQMNRHCSRGQFWGFAPLWETVCQLRA